MDSRIRLRSKTLACLLCVLTVTVCLLLWTYLHNPIWKYKDGYALKSTKSNTFKADWKSLDSRKIPQWYDDAKVGIFVHWGVFSVPSYKSEWFWWKWKGVAEKSYKEFMQHNYGPNFSYQEFAHDFKVEFFDPNKWAELFEASGAKYVVLTSKHHEGYTMWPSKVSDNWNVMDIGPHRDLVGELSESIRQRTNLRFGLYHSLLEWFNKYYLEDKINNFATNKFVTNKILPSLYEIVLTYKPDIVWSDGDNEANETYWQSKEFLAWLYSESPVKDHVVTNDKWGKGCSGQHGGVYLYNPNESTPAQRLSHKWEYGLSIDTKSWGYRREARIEDYATIGHIIKSIVETVSFGGNIIINIAPTKEGTILPIFEERLRQMGNWLDIAGEGIYGTKPWTHQVDQTTPDVWYTQKEMDIYCFFAQWPSTGELRLGSISGGSIVKIILLGLEEQTLSWSIENPSSIKIVLPAISNIFLKIKWMWVLKIYSTDNF